MATPEDKRVAKALAANKAINKRKRDIGDRATPGTTSEC